MAHVLLDSAALAGPCIRARRTHFPPMTNWTPLAWAAAVLIVVLLAAAIVWRRTGRRTKETPTVALVRRRRELQSRLQSLAGEEGDGILRQEAQRMRASPTDLQVLEAAIARAERLASTRR